MTRKLPLLALALLAGCATQPPPVLDGPPPVIITEDSPPPEPQARAQAPKLAAVPATQRDAPPPEAPKQPARAEAGEFRIVVASADTARIAARWARKAETAGYRAEVQAVEVGGKTRHRVLLTGYATLGEATAALPLVKEQLSAPGAWVTRRRAPAN